MQHTGGAVGRQGSSASQLLPPGLVTTRAPYRLVTTGVGCALWDFRFKFQLYQPQVKACMLSTEL